MKITVDQALQNLMDVVRETVLEEVTKVFAPGKPASKPKAHAPNGKPAAKAKTRARSKPKTSEDLGPLVGFVKAHPGLNGAKIAEGLGVKRLALTSALRRAKEQGLLKVKGHTRGATWWVK